MAKDSLADKVVIITGGAKGIGRALALGFAEAGAKGVAIIDNFKPALGKKLLQEMAERSAPGRAIFVPGDITRWADCRRAVALTVKAFRGVHVLINNAGLGELATGGDRQPFWTMNEKGFKRLMDVNIVGAFQMAKAVAPRLIKQKWGRILNVTKSRESMLEPQISAYGPSKAGLEAMALCWAVELLDTGVAVNWFSPGGPVDTDFMVPKRRREAKQRGVLLDPAIVVPPALWLASEESDGIVGCHYVGRRWDKSLPAAEAAEKARDPAIFLPPRNGSKLTKTWAAPKV
jgi:NAD(P)-dependent dehydrogenase (short-subunit alcohol dehydrogenase family)